MHIRHAKRKPSEGVSRQPADHPSDARQERNEDGHRAGRQKSARPEMKGKAMEYPAKFTPDRTAGGFVVTFPDVPEAITQGDTIEEAMAMASEALELGRTFYTEY